MKILGAEEDHVIRVLLTLQGWRGWKDRRKTGRPLGVKTSAGFAISDFTLVSPGLEFQFNTCFIPNFLFVSSSSDAIASAHVIHSSSLFFDIFFASHSTV